MNKVKKFVLMLLIISLFLLCAFVVKSPDMFFSMGKYDTSDNCLKFVCKLKGNDDDLILRSMRYNAMGMKDRCFDTIKYVYDNRDEKNEHTKSEVLLFIEFGISAGEYDEVIEIIEKLKKYEQETKDGVVSAVALKKMTTACTENPDIDDKLKLYAMDFIDFKIQLYKEDESKSSYLAAISLEKQELEKMLKKNSK